MFKASSSPSSCTFLSVCLLSSILQWTALELEWPEQDRQLLGQCAPERERGEAREGGCTDFNEMHSVNGHSPWRGQEEKGALSLSLHSPLLCAPPAPCLSLSHSPALLPSWRGALLGARWYPRCPGPASLFSYIHQPPLRSEVTTGHLNGSPWQQWPWRLREWQRLFVVARLPWTVLLFIWFCPTGKTGVWFQEENDSFSVENCHNATWNF